MSPIGTQGHLSPSLGDLSFEERLRLKSAQGRRCFGVDLKIVDEDGAPLPHDSEAAGELYVRGNSIVSGYFNNPEATAAVIDKDGWFGTGDVATIGPRGFLRITDRAKDLIKSGGEWISSIDVENLALAHPSVANAAVIAVPHPKWDERPLLVVVLAEGAALDKDALNAHMAKTLAKWQLPDDVIAVEALPLTATGKVSKLTLRQQFGDHVLPDLHKERG